MLYRIALSDFDVVDKWTAAPLGSLVQVALCGRPAVGWRCAFPSRTDCLLVVDGDTRGRLLMSTAGAQPGPGLDVSRVLELAVLGPGVSDMGLAEFQPGAVVWSEGSMFVLAASSEAELTGYVCIASAACTSSVGLVFREIALRTLVAKAIGVRPRNTPPAIVEKARSSRPSGK